MCELARILLFLARLKFCSVHGPLHELISGGLQVLERHPFIPYDKVAVE
jgi:hypothetical protein